MWYGMNLHQAAEAVANRRAVSVVAGNRRWLAHYSLGL
jgi:hypothetical protein